MAPFRGLLLFPPTILLGTWQGIRESALCTHPFFMFAAQWEVTITVNFLSHFSGSMSVQIQYWWRGTIYVCC